MVEKIISQVKFEIGQIDNLLESFAGVWERTKNELQLFLNSFSNGNIE